MVDAGEQRAEELAVVDHAADRNAAEADAVIAALAADQALARAAPAHVVIGEGDLQRRVGRLRAGVGEEDMVEVGRSELGEARGRARRPADARTGSSARSRAPPPAFGWRRRSGPGCGRRCSTTAPPSRREFAPLGGKVMHVLRARDEPRPLLEGAVGRERQPERREIVGNVRARGGAGTGGGGHAGSRSGDFVCGDDGSRSFFCPVVVWFAGAIQSDAIMLRIFVIGRGGFDLQASCFGRACSNRRPSRR